MKLRTLLIAVAVLAALSLAVFFASHPSAAVSNDARLGQALLDQAVIEQATQLRFSDAGKTISLVKQSDGSWRVPAYYDFPADVAKIARSVSELSEAKLTRLVTTNPERIARLEFKDSQISLLGAGDKPLWAVTLGKTNESGGRFVRFGAEPKAYLASLNSNLDLEPKNWARTDLLGLKSEDIAQLEIPFDQAAPVVVTREKKDTPFTSANLPTGQKLKADRITSTLNSLTALAFTETSDPSDANAVAAKANQRVFKLKTFDGKNYTVALGRKPEEKKIKAPVADEKGGLAALGKSTDLLPPGGDAKPGEPKSATDALTKIQPEFETIPAGPVYVSATSSDEKASVNALMQKRAFQISDYVLTSLPQKPDELFEPAPAAAK
jgi:hypothetical protein